MALRWPAPFPVFPWLPLSRPALDLGSHDLHGPFSVPHRAVLVARVLILGAGPAGLAAGWRLRHLARAEVFLIDQQKVVGGSAASFTWRGHRLDLGSHRLHASCERSLLAHMRRLLGEELLERPRHGRLLLEGRWLRFPLRPLDLLLHAPRGFLAAVVRDWIWSSLRPSHVPADGESLASVLLDRLGPAICKNFYFPYARKIWGLEPEQLAAIQARRRVSTGSLSALVKKLLPRPAECQSYFYPRGGFGRLAESLAAEAGRLGARFFLSHRVMGVQALDGGNWRVSGQGPEGSFCLEGDHVWSTLPLNRLVQAQEPLPEKTIQAAARSMRFRSLVLVYLELERERFTSFDAHYLPDCGLSLTRLSEPKNYALRHDPPGRTVLCAELPADPKGALWRLSDEDLRSLVAADLERSGLPLPDGPLRVATRRIKAAYPLYPLGFEEGFELLDAYVRRQPGLLSLGRLGLFAHDNTHHALRMGWCAAECLREDGTFDETRWAAFRQEFRGHVVED